MKIPDFAPADKASLMELIQANKSLLTTKEIGDKAGLRLIDAKRLMVHLNSQKGHCHRCSFQGLVGENAIRSRYKSLNLNW